MSNRDETFGCETCWPSDAEAAWKARDALSRGARLADESHFGVTLMSCPHCAQSFVSVFTETIDWADGDDPQYTTLLPLTAEETEALSARPADNMVSALNALDPTRRALCRDYPKGAATRTCWGKGIHVGPHD
jgi:hypothetical protein